MNANLGTIAYLLEKASNLPPCCFVCLSFMVTQCSYATAMPERSKMFIFSGLTLSRLQTNKVKNSTWYLMTFAGEFFTEEIERQSRYDVVEIEVSFVSKGCATCEYCVTITQIMR